MIESTNANHCPKGTYFGWWGGYKCHVILSGTTYEWDMPEGVRGVACRQVIRVKGGKAFIDPTETWEYNQLPEVDFKYIKVVYVLNTAMGKELSSSILQVPLRWRYTPEAEEKLAERLNIKPKDIVNIMYYDA